MAFAVARTLLPETRRSRVAFFEKRSGFARCQTGVSDPPNAADLLLRLRRRQVLILLFQFINHPLNPIRLVDQTLLFATKGGDRFVLRLRCFAQGSVMWGDFPRPELHQAIHLLNQRTFDTEWYGYPSLPAYLTVVAMTVWKPVYRNVHGHHFRNDLPSEDAARTTSGYNYDLISPPELIIAGRAIAAGLSIGMVMLAGAIASRLRGRVAGLLAMLITTLCPALVLRASNVIVDTFAAFFALLAIYFYGRIRPNDKWSGALAAVAGLAAGLAFASKYTAGAVFAALVATIWALPAAKKFRLRL